MILLFLACTAGSGGDSASDTGASHEVTSTHLSWSTDPSPMVAGEEGTFSIQVLDQDGLPVEDLQENHERMVHTMFVSADWTSFQHLHHEDFASLSADDLRQAQFHFPVTLPAAGSYFLMFGWAFHNEWLFDEADLEVEGEPAQQEGPDTTPTSEATAGDLHVSLAFTSPVVAGIDVSWTVSLSDAEGAPVIDVTPYLGADAHCALVNETNTWGSHTHAWFPEMGSMTPGMEMPQIYTGPDISFVYAFPSAGTYKMWVQFARESAPGEVYTAPFVFEVSP